MPAGSSTRPKGALDGMESWKNPPDAQRAALPCELALGLPLTNRHPSVLAACPRSSKQANKHDEIACGGHQRNSACLLQSRCATRGMTPRVAQRDTRLKRSGSRPCFGACREGILKQSFSHMTSKQTRWSEWRVSPPQAARGHKQIHPYS